MMIRLLWLVAFAFDIIIIGMCCQTGYMCTSKFGDGLVTGIRIGCGFGWSVG
jgi:hypothetical protein